MYLMMNIEVTVIFLDSAVDNLSFCTKHSTPLAALVGSLQSKVLLPEAKEPCMNILK